MKKLYTLMLTALMALTFTACEDEYIADTLEGTWSGTMFVSTYYDGRDYYATHSEITFSIDPFRFTKGSGYWVDYYSGDYHLSDSRFSGYIADGDNDVYFNLVHTSSPNWDNYRHWGYDDWCDDYYYSRQTRGDGNDSAIATPAKPVRQFGKKALE